MENDFVNVNAIQWWQQVVSAVKWALCWAECNDSQDNWSRIWNAFHFVVTCWGWLTGRLASQQEPFKGLSCPLCLCVCSLGNIFPLQLFFYLCQLPCWMLRDIGCVWTWVRGPALLFLLNLCSKYLVFICRRLRPQDKAACCRLSVGW